jgi:hypothetical protein
MRAFRLSVAFIYGFVLFYFVWVWFGGFMAARQVPASFFKLLGQEPALALINFGFHFLAPVALLVLSTLLFSAPFKTQARTVARTVVFGAAVSYVFWLVVFAIQGTPEGTSFLTQLQAQFSAPWWGWPALAAPFSAFALAYVAAAKLAGPVAEA